MNKPIDKKYLKKSTSIYLVYTTPETLYAEKRDESIDFTRDCIADNNFPVSSADDPIEKYYERMATDAFLHKIQAAEERQRELMADQISTQIKATDVERIKDNIEYQFPDFLDAMRDMFGQNRQQHRKAKADLKKLRKTFKLSREAKPNKIMSRFGHAGAFVTLETAITSFINVAGGVALFPAISSAVGVTLLNVFLFGYIICAEVFPRSQKVNSQKLWPFWLTLGTGLTAFTVAVNSLLSHYRSEGGDFAKAVEAFKNNPVGFSEMHGYFLFGLGMLVCAVAGFLFYTSRDNVIKYGEAGELETETLTVLEGVAEKARTGVSKLKTDFDRELLIADDNADDSHAASQAISDAADAVWETCSDELDSVQVLFERTIIQHRNTMQDMLGKDTPVYFNISPDLTPVKDAAKFKAKASFKSTLAAHKAQLLSFSAAYADARAALKNAVANALNVIKSELVYKGFRNSSGGQDD